MYPVFKVLALSIITIMLSSCTTKALWEATSPESYVRVRSDLVAEEDLQKKGLKYFKSDKDKAFYVEKNDFDRLKDYTVRLFGTPITVVIDAATSILVIGGIGVAGVVERKAEEQCDKDPACLQHKQKGTYSR